MACNSSCMTFDISMTTIKQLLPKNIRKLYIFFFNELWTQYGDSCSDDDVLQYGYRYTHEIKLPFGMVEPFYDDAIMGGSDKPQDMAMRTLPEHFFENTDDLFPSESNKDYRYLVKIAGAGSVVCFSLIIFRSGYIQLIQSDGSAGKHIWGTCEFDEKKHVKN